MLHKNSRLMKVLISGSIIGSLLFSTLTVAAYSAKDSGKVSAYARESVQYLYSKGIINVDRNGYLNPQNKVKRGEALKALALALDIDVSKTPSTVSFKDVPRTHQAYRYIEAAYLEGWVTGISKTQLGVDQLLTREQVAALFIRALGLDKEDVMDKLLFGSAESFKDSQAISLWAKDYVRLAAFSGLVKGTDERLFKPKDYITTEQFALMLDRLLTNTHELYRITELINISQKLDSTIDSENDISYPYIPKPIGTYISEVKTQGPAISGSKEHVGLAGTDHQFERGTEYIVKSVIEHQTVFGTLSIKSKSALYVPETEELYVSSVYPVGFDSITFNFVKPVDAGDAENKANYSIYDTKGNKIEINRVEYSDDFKSAVVYLTHSIDTRKLITFTIGSILGADGKSSTKPHEYNFFMGRNHGSNNLNSSARVDVTAKQFERISKNNYSININGSNIAIKEKPVYKNGEILIPSTLLKYLKGLSFIPDMGIADPKYKGVVSVENMEDINPRLLNTQVSFKPGVAWAVRDLLSSITFEDNIRKNHNNVIPIKTSAQKINGTWMLPLSAIEKVFELDAYVDEVNSILYLNNEGSRPSAVKEANPIALKNVLGSIARNTATISSLNFKASMNDIPDSKGRFSTTVLSMHTRNILLDSMQMFNMPGTVIQMGVSIETGGKSTILDSHTMLINDSGIFERTGDYGTSIGPLYDNMQKKYFEGAGFTATNFNTALYYSFDKLPLKKAGNTMIDNKRVTAYRVSIPAGFDRKYTNGYSQGLLGTLKSMVSYGEWFDPIIKINDTGFSIDMFLDNKGNLIKETITMESPDRQSDSRQSPYDLRIEMDYSYKNN